MSFPVQLVFSDGQTNALTVMAGESVLDAARAQGIALLVDCEQGSCGTCQARVSRGSVDMSEFNPAVLAESERAAGAVLLCRARAIGPAVIELPYSGDDAMAASDTGCMALVEAVEHVAADTMALTLTTSEQVAFLPGQYVNIAPDQAFQRSFSMANPPGAKRLEFFIALHPGGQFSNWLGAARAGDGVALSAARGTFFLREDQRPKVMVAGGTGLAPFLSMLEQMASDDREGVRTTPVVLLIGARHDKQLFGLRRLEQLKCRLPGLQVHVSCDEVGPGSVHRKGRVTQLLEELEIDRSSSIYACGPPPMVEAVKGALKSKQIPSRQLYVEKFTG
jgi:benzoate/toluate 1,2-dioxygenase reductase subunit